MSGNVAKGVVLSTRVEAVLLPGLVPGVAVTRALVYGVPPSLVVDIGMVVLLTGAGEKPDLEEVGKEVAASTEGEEVELASAEVWPGAELTRIVVNGTLPSLRVDKGKVVPSTDVGNEVGTEEVTKDVLV